MFRRLTLAVMAVVAGFLSTAQAQEDTIPGLKPAVVQEKMDNATLVEKASFLLGYNMFKGIQSQGGNVDMAELTEGIKVAQSGEDRSSYILGYNMMYQARMRGKNVTTDEFIEGVKAAQSGEDKKSFITGYELMGNLKKQDAGLEIEKILAGMKSASSGQELPMSKEETSAVMSSFQKVLEERQVAKMKAMTESNDAETRAFMAKNKAENPGVKELPNGVQYQVLTEGTGPKPSAEDRIKVNYHGTFLNGKVFDSTTQPPSGLPPEPAEFNVSGVVPGFSAALQAMNVGSKWKVVIPGKLGYGVQGRGEIGPNQALMFEIELLEILPKK